MEDPVIEKAERWEKRLAALHSLTAKMMFTVAMVVAEAILFIGFILGLYQLKFLGDQMFDQPAVKSTPR